MEFGLVLLFPPLFGLSNKVLIQPPKKKKKKLHPPTTATETSHVVKSRGQIAAKRLVIATSYDKLIPLW